MLTDLAEAPARTGAPIDTAQRRAVARPVTFAVPARTPVVDRPVPMEIGSVTKFKPLTEEEKNRRRREGLCMYCGKAGHVALRCPAKQHPVRRAAATKSMTFSLVEPAAAEQEPSNPKNV